MSSEICFGTIGAYVGSGTDSSVGEDDGDDKVGADDSAAVGEQVDDDDGIRVGVVEGNAVGIRVDDDEIGVGDVDGLAVGLRVDDDDGSIVGVADGLAVGVQVSANDGSEVGVCALLGFLVGLSGYLVGNSTGVLFGPGEFAAVGAIVGSINETLFGLIIT